MGIKLNKRTMVVQKAGADIGLSISELVEEHELTPAEVVSILAGKISSWNNYALRYERHGDYEKKADED